MLTTDERLKIETLLSQVKFLLQKLNLSEDRKNSITVDSVSLQKKVDLIAEYY